MKSSVLSLLLLTFVLAGCSSQPTKQVVTVTKTSYMTLDDSFLVPCIPEEPISEVEYLDFDLYQREAYLTEYTIKLYEVIKTCNTRIESIKTLNDKYKELNRTSNESK